MEPGGETQAEMFQRILQKHGLQNKTFTTAKK